MMTIQTATTARNTTNGYMRNYVYALDNLGEGIYVKIIINHFRNNLDKLNEISDNRGTSLKILKESYDIDTK